MVLLESTSTSGALATPPELPISDHEENDPPGDVCVVPSIVPAVVSAYSEITCPEPLLVVIAAGWPVNAVPAGLTCAHVLNAPPGVLWLLPDMPPLEFVA